MTKTLSTEVIDGVTVTKYAPGVAQGLRKTDYLPADVGGFGGRKAEPIKTDDPKYDMYANALPAAIRGECVERGMDVRALYKRYREIGKDALIAEVQAGWSAEAERAPHGL